MSVSFCLLYQKIAQIHREELPTCRGFNGAKSHNEGGEVHLTIEKILVFLDRGSAYFTGVKIFS